VRRGPPEPATNRPRRYAQGGPKNPDTWNTRYIRNYETERRKNLTQSWERKMEFLDAKWWRHNKSKMADGRHIENSFFAISRRHIGRSTRNLEQRWRITCRYRSRDQNCNFRKLKMAYSRHFENSIISISQPRIIRFRSNLVNGCKFPSRAWKFDENRNFSNSRWRTDAILKIVFGYISAPYWPINAKFGREIRNHMAIHITWPELQFSKIQDGGRPPFWK